MVGEPSPAGLRAEHPLDPNRANAHRAVAGERLEVLGAQPGLLAIDGGLPVARVGRVIAEFADHDIGPLGRRLSDHDGYLVRYRFSWNAEVAAAAAPAPAPAQGTPTETPQVASSDVKMSGKP